VGLIALLAIWFVPGYVPQTLGNAVRHADLIMLYEGLPHQLYEEDLLNEERRTKPVREIGDYPFYRNQLSVNPGEAAIISPWSESTYDLDGAWKRQLHVLLLAYRRSRPLSPHRTAVDENVAEGW
jgi:hypothetical protein